jgi:hypothetical protein
MATGTVVVVVLVGTVVVVVVVAAPWEVHPASATRIAPSTAGAATRRQRGGRPGMSVK